MLEANQRLMNQLMQGVLKTNLNLNQPPGNGGNLQPSGGGGGGNGRSNPWQKEKKGDSIQMYGKTWWWCPQHNQGKGMYVRHKPENHDKWLAAKNAGGPFFVEQE